MGESDGERDVVGETVMLAEVVAVVDDERHRDGVLDTVVDVDADTERVDELDADYVERHASSIAWLLKYVPQ